MADAHWGSDCLHPTTCIETDRRARRDAESLNSTTKLNVPHSLGLPRRFPRSDSESHGNGFGGDQAYGGAPFAALRVWEYSRATVAGGRDAVMISGSPRPGCRSLGSGLGERETTSTTNVSARIILRRPASR